MAVPLPPDPSDRPPRPAATPEPAAAPATEAPVPEAPAAEAPAAGTPPSPAAAPLARRGPAAPDLVSAARIVTDPAAAARAAAEKLKRGARRRVVNAVAGRLGRASSIARAFAGDPDDPDAPGGMTGVLAAGIARNPVSNFLSSKIPGFNLRGKSAKDRLISIGLGCGGGCGCSIPGCGMGIVGCLFPFLVIILIVTAVSMVRGTAPDFQAALFCETGNQSACSENTVGLTMSPKELPAGAMVTYQSIEDTTGVPWFYLAAWERVATDFGQRRLENILSGADIAVPPDAVEVHTASGDAAGRSPGDESGINVNIGADGEVIAGDAPPPATVDEGGGFTDEAYRNSVVAEAQSDTDALRSTLRGGSFGLMLTTAEEWKRYGSAIPPGGDAPVLRDPWTRLGAAAITADSLVDAYTAQAAVNGGRFTFPATNGAQLITRGMDSWIIDLAKRAGETPLKAGDTANPRTLAIAVMGSDWCSGDVLQTPVVECGLFSSLERAGAVTDTWPADSGAPNAGKRVTQAERWLLCTVTIPRAAREGGACDRYRPDNMIAEANGQAATLKDAVKAGYDPSIGIGEQVTNWPVLTAVFGELLSRADLWGGDREAASAITIETQVNGSVKQVRVNAYAAAVNRYAESLYRAWSESQIAGGLQGAYDADVLAVGARNRVEFPEVALWVPAIERAEKDRADKENRAVRPSPPRAFTLAVLRADGAFGCALRDPKKGLPPPEPVAVSDGRTNPSNVWNCWLWGTGRASVYNPSAVERDPGGTSVDGSTAFAAMPHCSFTRRHKGPPAADGGAGNCGSVEVTVRRDDGTRVTKIFPVYDFCDCYVTTGPDYPIAGVTSRSVVDLTPAAWDALGVSPREATVSLVPPAAPVEWPYEVKLAAELDRGDDHPNRAAAALIEELASYLPERTTSPTLLDWATAAIERCQAMALGRCTPGVNGSVIPVPDPDPAAEAPLGTIDDSPYAAALMDAYSGYVAAASPLGGASVSTFAYGEQPTSALGFVWPVVGASMTAGFGPRTGMRSADSSILLTYRGNTTGIRYSHGAIDLSFRRCDDPIVAAGAGWLTWTPPTGGEAGMIMIRHSIGGQAINTFYGHMAVAAPAIEARLAASTKTVGGRKAVWVERGELISFIGNTGHSFGCHLHFAVYLPGKTMPGSTEIYGDPNGYIESNPGYYTALPKVRTWIAEPLKILPPNPAAIAPRDGNILLPEYLAAYPSGSAGAPPGFPPPARRVQDLWPN